jgi:hypothetical protein
MPAPSWRCESTAWDWSGEVESPRQGRDWAYKPEVWVTVQQLGSGFVESSIDFNS